MLKKEGHPELCVMRQCNGSFNLQSSLGLTYRPTLCPANLLDCWKQFSLPARQCHHTCNMARNCLEACHVIPPCLAFWISIHLQLTTSGIFETDWYLTYTPSQLPHYPNWNASWLNSGYTFHIGGCGGVQMYNQSYKHV